MACPAHVADHENVTLTHATVLLAPYGSQGVLINLPPCITNHFKVLKNFENITQNFEENFEKTKSKFWIKKSMMSELMRSSPVAPNGASLLRLPITSYLSLVGYCRMPILVPDSNLMIRTNVIDD